jgi:uncharacterized protein (TIGR02001 family)
MTSREVGTIKSIALGAAAAVACMALPAHAGDNKLALSGSAVITTDYVFRGLSQTSSNPAAQVEFDATYGIFYAGIWASNLDFGGAVTPGLAVVDVASLEIDYYAGITPMWKGITFNIAGLYYTYPGAFDPAGEFDYFELKTGASYTFNEKLTVSLTNYWSPENFADTGHNDVLEVGLGYAFAGKLFNFFSPSVSGVYGHQWGQAVAGGFDYNYWNAGLTLGFLDHWSADVRYWDSDAGTNCVNPDDCDARVVGTVKATF